MPAQCPNVRQCSSEQGLWTPAALRPAIWVKSNADKTIIVSSGDGDVKSVTDLSSGVPFSVTGSVKLDTSQLNGKPTLRINNTSTAQLLTASYSYAGNEITLISLHRNAATASGRTIYGRLFSLYLTGEFDYATASGGILTYGVGGVNGVRFYRNTTINVTSSPTINDVWGCAVLTRSGTGVTMALDGGSRVSGTTASNNFNFNKVRIGNDDGPREDSGLNGYIAENILITRAITQEEENKLFGYLAWEWGRVTSLPIDHPYRFAPPRDNRILTRKRRSIALTAGAVGVSGGGTTYNDSISETASSADSSATALTAVSAFSESATAADLSETAMTALAAFTESTTAADVIDAALSLQLALAESTASSDDLSSTATLAVVLSEILSALDSATTGSVFSDTITESAAADAVKSALMEMSAAISESASASDAHDTALTAVNAILEASQSGDSLASIQTFAADLAESLAAIFAVTTGSIYFDTLGESAVADATKSSMMAMVSALSESSTATEANATTLSSVNALLESLAAGDNQTSAQTMAATLAESLASLFAVTEGNVFGESLTESAGLADALASAILSNVSFTEGVSAADSQSVSAVLADIINEAILAGSSQSAQAVFADALAETLLALVVESSTVVGEIISPATMLTNRVKSVLAASQKVHDLLGLSLGTLGNVARPRIFTGQARTFLCGRNRGRLPFFEIHVSGQSFDHESYSAGAITQTALLTIHLGGKDPGVAGLLAERVLLASIAAIRNGSDNLLALGDETLGDLEQGPWGHRRTMTFTVTQTYDRTTYEVP